MRWPACKIDFGRQTYIAFNCTISKGPQAESSEEWRPLNLPFGRFALTSLGKLSKLCFVHGVSHGAYSPPATAKGEMGGRIKWS
jgi:hypothetical protein